MDDVMLEQHLENLDRRLGKVEQILPTLATKEDLKVLATKEELKLLATKEDLKLLATKDEVRELRRHMDVLTESLREDIHLIAAHVATGKPKATGTPPPTEQP